jgi:hypothetical protein
MKGVCRELEESNDSLSSTLAGKSFHKKPYFCRLKDTHFLVSLHIKNFPMVSISVPFFFSKVRQFHYVISFAKRVAVL